MFVHQRGFHEAFVEEKLLTIGFFVQRVQLFLFELFLLIVLKGANISGANSKVCKVFCSLNMSSFGIARTLLETSLSDLWASLDRC